jgi:hypothetical protein
LPAGIRSVTGLRAFVAERQQDALLRSPGRATLRVLYTDMPLTRLTLEVAMAGATVNASPAFFDRPVIWRPMPSGECFSP